MVRVAATAGILALSGCSLLLSDDLSGGSQRDATIDASTADGAGDAVANDGGATDGETPIQGRPVGPLEVTVVPDSSVTATVKGFFQLEFTPVSGWKPERVVDLGLPGNPNLAPSMFEPLFASVEGTTVGTSTDVDAYFFDVLDETPVRFAMTTFAHHPLPSGADAKTMVRWWIYASGRVAIDTKILNDGTSDLALPAGWIHSSFSVDRTREWNVVQGSEDRSVTFFLQEPSGLGMSALLHEPDGNIGSRSAHERHWSGSSLTLAPTQSLSRRSELHLGVIPDEAAERVADARAPELGVLSGLARTEGGFDRRSGAYRMSVVENAAVSTFELTPVRARAYPAFEIGGLNAPNGWRLTLDGQTVASSASPVTPLGVARYEADSRRLLFVYLGTIAANATTEKRTFTLERL